MEVKIKLLPGGKMPTKGSADAAAFDCYAIEDIEKLPITASIA